MTYAQALDALVSDWIAWATHQIDGAELAARLAEKLEATGREVVKSADYPANDDGEGRG